MQIDVDAPETVFVSRQPILDATGKVFGYELLHRETAAAASAEQSETAEAAGARGLTDVVLGLGLDTLAEGKPAFLNFTRDLLVDQQAATLLPPGKTVIQLRRGLQVDEQVVQACHDLHKGGYRLALDFISDPESERLLPFVKFLKIDVRSMSTAAAATLVKRFSAGNAAKVIAEKVESAEAFKEAKAAGFQLFQGFYFCRPITCKSTTLPQRKLAYMQLLSALRQPNVGVREIEEIVKHDVSLSYRVLRCVNSAAFGLRSEVTSIRQALVMIGIAPIRKWVSVWSIAGLTSGGTSELATVSLLRARCCELLGEKLGGKVADSEMFLLGLCSLLDAILDRPLAEAIADLPLPADVRAALMGDNNVPRQILDVVVAYENGNWDEALDKAHALGLSDDSPATVYSDALKWARELSRAAA
jgi:EAL and modified HD-GYP domain-containing signal transduction protein